ncbi:MAG: hypothetical protein HRU36_04880 [Rickettsiales bacterium]|nr:hypothetical protein [Rickettsiales bacterium]
MVKEEFPINDMKSFSKALNSLLDSNEKAFLETSHLTYNLGLSTSEEYEKQEKWSADRKKIIADIVTSIVTSMVKNIPNYGIVKSEEFSEYITQNQHVLFDTAIQYIEQNKDKLFSDDLYKEEKNMKKAQLKHAIEEKIQDGLVDSLKEKIDKELFPKFYNQEELTEPLLDKDKKKSRQKKDFSYYERFVDRSSETPSKAPKRSEIDAGLEVEREYFPMLETGSIIKSLNDSKEQFLATSKTSKDPLAGISIPRTKVELEDRNRWSMQRNQIFIKLSQNMPQILLEAVPPSTKTFIKEYIDENPQELSAAIKEYVENKPPFSEELYQKEKSLTPKQMEKGIKKHISDHIIQAVEERINQKTIEASEKLARDNQIKADYDFARRLQEEEDRKFAQHLEEQQKRQNPKRELGSPVGPPSGFSQSVAATYDKSERKIKKDITKTPSWRSIKAWSFGSTKSSLALQGIKECEPDKVALLMTGGDRAYAEAVHDKTNTLIEKAIYEKKLVPLPVNQLNNGKTLLGGGKDYMIQSPTSDGKIKLENPKGKFTAIIKYPRIDARTKRPIPNQSDIIEYKDGKVISVIQATQGKSQIVNIEELRNKAKIKIPVAKGKETRIERSGVKIYTPPSRTTPPSVGHSPRSRL